MSLRYRCRICGTRTVLTDTDCHFCRAKNSMVPDVELTTAGVAMPDVCPDEWIAEVAGVFDLPEHVVVSVYAKFHRLATERKG